MSAGSLTLGGNVTIALGPLGRNGEAASSVNSSGKLAMMYVNVLCHSCSIIICTVISGIHILKPEAYLEALVLKVQ